MRIWRTVKNVLATLMMGGSVILLAAASVYFVAATGKVLKPDEGHERVLKVYSRTGELIDERYGFITTERSADGVAVYSIEGTRYSVQGAIITLQDIE